MDKPSPFAFFCDEKLHTEDALAHLHSPRIISSANCKMPRVRHKIRERIRSSGYRNPTSIVFVRPTILSLVRDMIRSSTVVQETCLLGNHHQSRLKIKCQTGKVVMWDIK